MNNYKNDIIINNKTIKYSDDENKYAKDIADTLPSGNKLIGSQENILPFKTSHSYGSTDVGDVSRFIKDGETGFVVQPGADNLIAEKIMWVLDNPHHAKEMGRRARTVALANFHHVKVARLHESFYQELLKSPACS